MKMTGTGEGEANDEKYYENKEGGQGSPFCKLSTESRFLRHPGIPDGRKIWQKSRKIKKKDLFHNTY